MKKIYYLTTIVAILTLLFSCSRQNKEKTESLNFESENKISNQNTDSVELIKLTRQVYKWHMNNNLDDFPYKYDDIQDSIFIGIDWGKYQDNIQEFKKTDFFSNDFMKRHKEIASNIDSSIRKANIAWRNAHDGVPIWETNANNWCGCQDYPNDYWEKLIIDSLKINNDFADFIWNWDKDFHHGYKVTAKKEEGKWKINSLDGFKNFYSVEVYDKMMKDEKSE